MSTIFVVVQKAIYRHSIVGLFKTTTLAIAAAQETARLDGDDHHEYQVIPFETGVSYDFSNYRGKPTGRPQEPDAIFICAKSNPEGTFR